jgi:hypothetical protein
MAGKIAGHVFMSMVGGMEIAEYPATVRRSTAEIVWNA